jgi:hypothetical protein
VPKFIVLIKVYNFETFSVWQVLDKTEGKMWDGPLARGPRLSTIKPW